MHFTLHLLFATPAEKETMCSIAVKTLTFGGKSQYSSRKIPGLSYRGTGPFPVLSFDCRSSSESSFNTLSAACEKKQETLDTPPNTTNYYSTLSLDMEILYLHSYYLRPLRTSTAKWTLKVHKICYSLNASNCVQFTLNTLNSP